MNKEISLTPSNIVKFILLFFAALFIFYTIYKIFKKCCQWCAQYNVALFSKKYIFLYAIPVLLASLSIDFKLDFIKDWMILIAAFIFIIIPTIIFIKRAGIGYGIIITIFRIIAGCLLGAICIESLTFIIVGIIAIGFIFASAIENSLVYITLDGEIIVLQKISDHMYVDFKGNFFTPMGNNMWINNNGDIYYTFHND